jgi:hypothetical protein
MKLFVVLLKTRVLGCKFSLLMRIQLRVTLNIVLQLPTDSIEAATRTVLRTESNSGFS